MTRTPDIARLEMPSLKVAHCALPAWREGEINSVSTPGSIGVAFTPQSGAVVQYGNGRIARRDVSPNSVCLGGHEPIAWLDVGQPSDIIEVTADPALRREIAKELRVPEHADLDDIHNWSDPVIQAIAVRFRAGLRRWQELDALEADGLTHAAYARVLQRQFGGRARKAGALDATRLAVVTDFIVENLHRDLSIAELAGTAALSPYHFARSFRCGTGLAPHRFVTALRLERAVDRLMHSRQTVEEIAAGIGLSNLSHFRRLFRTHYGCAPSELRR
jgi:AraC family transcriptional regulator